MGQLLLPLFSHDTTMITQVLGYREQDGTVFYLLSGLPIYSHRSDDHNRFRYITSNLILQGLCSNQNIVDAFHVSTDSVRRWKRTLDTKGEEAFFTVENRHGRTHKLLPAVLERIQIRLDKGESVNSIAKVECIAEGTIRNGIKQGKLKKKMNLK